jgi:hypothetical protein
MVEEELARLGLDLHKRALGRGTRVLADAYTAGEAAGQQFDFRPAVTEAASPARGEEPQLAKPTHGLRKRPSRLLWSAQHRPAWDLANAAPRSALARDRAHTGSNLWLFAPSSIGLAADVLLQRELLLRLLR